VFHLKGCQNYSPVRRFCQVFSGVWNYGKTRSLVFFMLHGISFPSFNGMTQEGTCLGEGKLVRDSMCQLLEKNQVLFKVLNDPLKCFLRILRPIIFISRRGKYLKAFE